MNKLLKYVLVVLALIVSAGVLRADYYVEIDTIANASTVQQIDSSTTIVINNSPTISAYITPIYSDSCTIKESKPNFIINKWHLKLIALIVLLLISGGAYWISSIVIRDGFFKSVPYNTLNNALKFISRGLFVIFALFLLFLVSRIFFPSLFEVDFTTLGEIGDFTGGVIGTLIAVFAAIYVVKSYKRQVAQSRTQTFEGTCATMLELHKQNVQEIEIELPGGKKIKGRKAFPELVSEYCVLFDIVNQAIIRIVSEHKDECEKWKDEIEQLKLAHKLTYGYFLYSPNTYMLTTDDSSNLYDLCSEVAKEVEKCMNKPFPPRCAFERHTILGHYYRHLYNMVKYIDTADNIKSEHKDKYCKIVRSQLSDYEQILLYYNTLSPLGQAWNKPLGETDREKMCLIAKYRLLKNCPYYLRYYGIKPSQTYATEIAVYRKMKERFFETGPLD